MQSLSQVADRMGLTLPTTHRLLRALQSKELLVFAPDTKRYSLGPTIMRLAGTIMGRDDLLTTSMPALERLVAATRETVGIHYPIGASRVCIAELESPQPIRMSSGIGHAYPLHAGAPSRVLLAWGDQARFDLATLRMRRLTSLTPTNRKALRAEFGEVRRRGYAMSFGETVEGASSLAAPILDSRGVALAAVNITGPLNRWTKARMLKTAPLLLREARLISRLLGHRAGGSRAAAAGIA